MKKAVWTFGLISGGIFSLMMLLTFPFIDRIGFDTAEIIGYTTLVAGFLFIFFGVRAIREQAPGRRITFRRAFGAGLLINLIASVCYVATWQVIYYRVAPDFPEKYGQYYVEKERAAGASEAQIAEKTAEMRRFADLYRNPFVNIGITFLEVFPVGAIMSLIAAAVLRTRGSVPEALPRAKAVV